MPSRRPLLQLSLDGGLSTDAGPSAPPIFRGDSTVSVPWLVRAENVIYELDGWIHKMPGAAAYNATTIGATTAVTGIFDYWRSTTSGSPQNRRVITAGTQVFSTEADGVWTSIITGLESNRIPNFLVYEDVLIINTDSTTDVPRTWNQTTAANLGGSPPNASFMVEHKDRVWAAGVDSNKSRLYYSILSSAADWTGTGSGSIDVSTDDGDVITGLRSHKNQLLIFKGPNQNSVHYLDGSAPTGSDAFSLRLFVRGVGCTGMNSIVTFGTDDLAWADDHGIHSLKATAAYGNYTDAFLSRDISSFWLDGLSHSRMTSIQSVNFSSRGQMLWTASRAGSTTNNTVLMLDYRFAPARWAFWPAYAIASLGMVKDSDLLIPWAGTYGGTVLRLNRTARNVNNAAYNMNVLFPYLSLSDSSLIKTVTTGRVSIAPKGNYSFTFGYQRDDAAQQTESVSQGGGATLGTSTNQFVLGTSTLAGGRFIHQLFDMSGEFREIQINLQQGVVDQDLELHGIGLQVESPVMAEATP